MAQTHVAFAEQAKQELESAFNDATVKSCAQTPGTQLAITSSPPVIFNPVITNANLKGSLALAQPGGPSTPDK